MGNKTNKVYECVVCKDRRCMSCLYVQDSDDAKCSLCGSKKYKSKIFECVECKRRCCKSCLYVQDSVDVNCSLCGLKNTVSSIYKH